MNPYNEFLSDNCTKNPVTKPLSDNPVSKFNKVMNDFNRHLSVAVELIGDDPDLTIDNSEYLRALSEMVCDLNGLDTCDHKESMALLIVALAQNIHN